MSKTRSRFEIYMDTLAEIKGGTVIPTRIMYGANLSWKPLMQTLRTLTTHGLIEEQSNGDDKRTKKVYALTEKGGNVLKYFNCVKGLMELEKAIEISA